MTQEINVGALGDTQTSQASNTQTGGQEINQDDAVGALGDTQTSQASETRPGDGEINQDDAVGDSQIVTDSETLGLSKMSGNLTFDWEKIIRKSKAFEIPPNSEPNSPTDQKLAADRYEQFEAAFMVPEPSVSGIAESTNSSKNSSPENHIRRRREFH